MANILHIDHDEKGQQVVRTALERQHNVIAAADGSLAIQYCAMIQPDLILMNLSLPDLDGYELASRLKMFMPEIPMLLIADRAVDPVKTQGVSSSTDGLLTKPFDDKKLRRQVQALLPSQSKIVSTYSSASVESAAHHFEAQIAALNQANKRLASLNAISALIGTSLDLDHLTDEILAQIQKTIAFDSATLFLLKGDILEAAASRGFSEYRRGLNTYRRSGRNSAWRVVANKLPMIISDVTKSDYWEPRPELSKVKSWLGVPLIYKDRVVGVLTLDKNEPDVFSDADARYLFTLTYQIAIAVENAQLFQEWEKQSTRLKLINEVGQELSTILDVDDLFQTLAKAIFDRLQYDQVAIYGIDQSRLLLTLRAIFGQNSLQLKTGVCQLPVDSGIHGKVVNTGRAVLLNDIDQENEAHRTPSAPIQSRLITPIFAGSQVEAIVDVGRKHVNGFNDQDLWTLSSLARQAATVIENARLYRAVQSYSNQLERIVEARTQRLHAIKSISQVVSQGLMVDELLAVIGQKISQIFSDDTADTIEVAIGLVASSYITVTVIYSPVQKTDKQSIAAADPRPALSNSFPEAIRVKINPTAPLGYVVSYSKPMLLVNANTEDDYLSPEAQAVDSANTLMIAPLITSGKTIGLIRVKSKLKNAFDDSDLEILESLAIQVASAIEHARLLQKTKEIAIIEERTRLASDMHDGVAQNLAYLMLQVDRCLNTVAEGSELEAHLERISGLLKKNIDELRRNIFDLRPVEFEDKSFFEVLENFVAEFGRRWGIETSWVLTGCETFDVPRDVQSSLYRILQETLSNARQHADCTRLSVLLALKDEQWITMKIEDNGHGFDVGQASFTLGADKDKGLGLVSMRERAERIGGKLVIESIPGRGTAVVVKLPLHLYRINGS